MTFFTLRIIELTLWLNALYDQTLTLRLWVFLGFVSVCMCAKYCFCVSVVWISMYVCFNMCMFLCTICWGFILFYFSLHSSLIFCPHCFEEKHSLAFQDAMLMVVNAHICTVKPCSHWIRFTGGVSCHVIFTRHVCNSSEPFIWDKGYL